MYMELRFSWIHPMHMHRLYYREKYFCSSEMAIIQEVAPYYQILNLFFGVSFRIQMIRKNYN